MNHRGMSGWPVIVAAVMMSLLVLLNLAVYAYRQSGQAAVTPDPLSNADARIAALEAEVAALKRKPDLSGYNEVYINGHFAGFRKRDPNELIQGISSPGYSDMPVGRRIPRSIQDMASGHRFGLR